VKRLLPVFLLALAATASAHDTWLSPRSFVSAPGATLLVELTSGMAFPELEYAPELDRLQTAKLRIVGLTEEVKKRERGEKATALYAGVRHAGLATVWVSTKPNTLTLEPKLVDEYLAEIGAQESAGRAWAARKEPKTWRETYRKHAKTFVLVGGAPDDTWKQPVGLDLELVPESDPFALRAGGSLGVRVLKRGRPLAGLGVAAVSAGGSRRLATTDAEGRAQIALERPGRLMLAATELRPKGGEWESDFSTLTLEVVP
jgi:uncharacterized GH25 family protein